MHLVEGPWHVQSLHSDRIPRFNASRSKALQAWIDVFKRSDITTSKQHSFYQTWHLKTILNLQGMRNMFLIQLPTCEKSFIATKSGMWIILDSKLKSASQLPSVPLCTERYVVGLYFDTNSGRNPMKQKLRQGQNLDFESCWIILNIESVKPSYWFYLSCFNTPVEHTPGNPTNYERNSSLAFW